VPLLRRCFSLIIFFRINFFIFQEKRLLKDAHETVDIAKGRGRYLEGTDMGTPIRKYDYGRFSVVTRADQTGP
jgi:hypothetical protein